MARAHGTGTLIKRGKFYMAKWMVKGKVYTRSTKCTNERDAKKKLEEFTKPFRENTDIEVIENLAAKVRVIDKDVKDAKNEKAPPLKTIFLIDNFKNDLSTGRIRAGTEENYEAIVTQFFKFTKREFVYEVTKDDVAKFLQHLKNKVGVGRYNYCISTMHRMFELAKKSDFRIRSNPWDGFSKLKEDKSRRRRELTDEEVKKLIDAAYEINAELGLMFEIAIYTGLRKSDCKALKWSSIDMKRKLIVVLPIKTSKTGKEARVPIHPKLEEKFKSLKHDESGFVMPNIAKKSRSALIKCIRKVFKKANVVICEKDNDGKSHILTGFHAFRHYFISNCVKNGIPISVVQQMVAHSSADMSLAYTHTSDADLRLPDYDGENEQITLKKTTVAALNKAKGIMELDDFIMSLLKGNATLSISHMKTKSAIELDELIDKLIPEK